MTEQASLDSLLPENDTATSQPAEPVATEPSGDTPAAAPPAAAQTQIPEKHAPIAVVQDERRKRQELELKVKELERMLQPRQQPQQQPPPDWYTDPEQAARVMQYQMQQTVYETKVNISQEMMRAQKPDYDEVEKIFLDAAERDPGLVQQIMRHPMPAKFAYEQGRKMKMLQEIGDDPDSYRKRIIDEYMASQGQQPAATPQPARPAQARSPLPRSLAATPSVQPRDERGKFVGSASLESILDG